MAIQVIRNEIVSNVIRDLTLYFQSSSISAAPELECTLECTPTFPATPEREMFDGLTTDALNPTSSSRREVSRGGEDVDGSIR